jgi:asparagine synthase (glutamine-hydrolysing)
MLPRSIMEHRKVGFSVPWDSYMRDPHAYGHLLDDMIKSPIHEASPIPARALDGMIRDFRAGDNSRTLLLRQMLFTTLWYAGMKSGAAVLQSAV